MLGRILSTVALAGAMASIFYIFGEGEASPRVRFVLMQEAQTSGTDAGPDAEAELAKLSDPSPAL